jgi:hypothetical protein
LSTTTGEVPTLPGLLFDSTQLDSLEKEAVIGPETNLRIVFYQDEVLAASIEEAKDRALAGRPGGPPTALLRALQDERRIPFYEKTTVLAEGARRKVLAWIALGERPECLSRKTSSFGDGTEGLGLAMVGAGGEVYIYDFGHRNIKHVVIRNGRSAKPKIIPGLQWVPEDGAATLDGALFLLVDRWGNGVAQDVARFAVFKWNPGVEAWEESEPLLASFLEEAAIPFGSLRIFADLNGDVYVGTSSGRRLQVARESKLL